MISASYDSLFDQAQKSISDYVSSACYLLDEKFGNGYAEQNPDLVGRLVVAMSIDFATTAFAKSDGELTEAQLLSGYAVELVRRS